MLAFLQKRVNVMLPICMACDRRWTHGIVFRWLSILAPFVVGPIVGALVGMLSNSDEGLAIGIAIGFVGLLSVPLLVAKLVSEPRAVIAKRIDDHRALLRGVHPELLRAL
jgi:hypothetical protein